MRERERELQRLAQAHAAQLPKIRAELGNPFFYTGRPENAHQSESEYTGYRSHEAGADLVLEWAGLASQIRTLRKQLDQV